MRRRSCQRAEPPPISSSVSGNISPTLSGRCDNVASLVQPRSSSSSTGANAVIDSTVIGSITSCT